MKKIIVSLLAVLAVGTATVVIAQQDPVGDLFRKYAGKEGYTTVHVTGDLLKMAAGCDPEDNDLKFLAKLEEIKVLAQESKEGNVAQVNFHQEIWPALDKSAYKELLIVREKGQDVKMLARENDDIISEFLIIVSGENENVLVQIKGHLSRDELNKLSGSFDIKGMDHIAKLE